MNSKIYVGNLPYSATNESLSEHFGAFGTVASARIIMDRDTNRSKGFGFVEMDSESDAQEAISSLDGAELDGRALKVSAAKPQERRENRNDSRSFRY